MALNKIVLSTGGREEAPADVVVAGGTVTPGDLVILKSTGKYVRHDSAGANTLKVVAVENSPFNKGITDDYAADSQMNVYYCQTGDKVYVRLAQGSAAVVKGDYLESHGNGKFRKLASGTALFQAEEAVNADGGTDPLIKVTAL